MEGKIYDEIFTKKLLKKYVIISTAVLFSLISLVLSPLFSATANNIAYKYTAIPEIILILIELLRLAATVLSFSAVIFSVRKFGAKASSGLALIYIIALFIKCAADAAMTVIIFNVLNVSEIISITTTFFIDLAIFLIAILFAYGSYKKKNNVNGTIIKTGILIALSKIIPRIFYDISYGAPTDLTDLLWMVTYYLSDVLTGAVFAVLSIFLLKYLHKKTTAG